MCSGYSGDSCCLPIHENEVQDAYMHLVDTARTYVLRAIGGGKGGYSNRATKCATDGPTRDAGARAA